LTVRRTSSLNLNSTSQSNAKPSSHKIFPPIRIVKLLDTDFQKTVQTILQKGLRNAHAQQGVAIALDPRNGEILAMVTLPSYDDNSFATGISTEELTNLIQDPG
jgi:membrane carboxypeptidase/penicillin-binding protein PbpC